MTATTSNKVIRTSGMSRAEGGLIDRWIGSGIRSCALGRRCDVPGGTSREVPHRRAERTHLRLPIEQDRVIAESQRPEELPVDLREEMYVKSADSVSIEYRRWFLELVQESEQERGGA